MGKNDFLTPKAIANRIKSKGLQKLRWYCQLCQKQCRDENGFKCHQLSESHRRQMELFGLNADRVVDGYSEEFEGSFMEHLRRAHPHSRVAAQVVYNEYIADRHHVHMNSTKWLTLTDFVKHLGREGKCKVEDTPKGWFITLIHTDPAEQVARERIAKRTARDEEEEERTQRLLDEQVKRARMAAAAAGEEEAVATALERGEGAEPIRLALAPPAQAGPGPSSLAAAAAAGGGGGRGGGGGGSARPLPAVPVFGEDEEDGGSGGGVAPGKKLSKLEELMLKDLEAKKRAKVAAAGAAGGGGGRVDAWLLPGIVVKVVSKALKAHGYYKQKGVVERVVERYLGEVALLGSGDVVRVDQAELETVIPQPGGQVLVVNGPHRGRLGSLVQIDTQRFQAEVALEAQGGEPKGRPGGTAALVWLDYEDISKLVAA